MTNKVEVTPHKLHSAAGDLNRVTGEVQGVLNRLATARNAHWGTWGDDDFGNHFFGGDSYQASDSNLTIAVGSKIELCSPMRVVCATLPRHSTRQRSVCW